MKVSKNQRNPPLFFHIKGKITPEELEKMKKDMAKSYIQVLSPSEVSITPIYGVSPKRSRFLRYVAR